MISESEPTNELFIIRDGFVKVASTRDDGTQQLLWVAGRFDIIPSESFFLPHASTRYEYIVLCGGSAFRVKKDDFLEKIAGDVNAMRELATGFSDHYDTLMQRIDSINQPRVREKILATLHGLATRFSAQEDCDLYDIGLSLTHQDIADMVGATREATSVMLKELMNEGLLQYDRTSFIIHTTKIAPLLHTPA